MACMSKNSWANVSCLILAFVSLLLLRLELKLIHQLKALNN